MANNSILSLPSVADPDAYESDYSFARSEQELELMDAVELGLSSGTTSMPDFATDLEDMTGIRPASQLSSFCDPLYAFTLMMYYLTNDFETSEIMCKLARWFSNPSALSFLAEFLRVDCSMVWKTWNKVFDWAFDFEDESFFRSLMRVMESDLPWIKWHDADILTLAARYDCHDICKRLIRCGISPNKPCLRRIGEFYFARRARAPPLQEAAFRGNFKSVEVLLDGGADPNFRCQGYTAAGLLVRAFADDNMDRERCLRTLLLVLERGADVHEPFKEDSAHDGECFDSQSRDCSDETLLDEACLTGDSELAGLIQKFDETPESLLTIWGIVSNAEKGIEKLQAYLRIAAFPRGSRRRRIQERGLYRCFGRPKALLPMLQAGFDLELRSLGRLTFRDSTGSYMFVRDFNHIKEIIVHTFKHTPFTSLCKDTISCILRKEVAMKAGLIELCLNTVRDSDWQHLLQSGFDVSGEDGIVVMAEAARRNNYAAVLTLKKAGVDINGTLKAKRNDYSILLLAITNVEANNELDLLQSGKRASENMLDFLVLQGADINVCQPVLSSSLRVTQSALRWLINNGLDLTGESICNIMMRRSLECNSLDLLQTLIHRNTPIFSPGEELKDYRSFTTTIHPLSFFISLKPSPEFISRVIDTGIDVNGTGQDTKSDSPLQAAARTKNLGIVQELISRGALVNETDYGCEDALQIACTDPVCFDLVRYLLENGADPKSIGRCTGLTALQLTLMSIRPDIRLIELLLAHGADVNALTRNWTISGPQVEDESLLEDESLYLKETFILQAALFKARNLGEHKRRVVEMLINNGARINARGKNRNHDTAESALEAVCKRNAPDCVDMAKLLLDRGAELDPPIEYRGQTCLEYACSAGNVNLIKLLLDQGMSPNPRNSFSEGPLAIAAKKGDLASAILLLAARANVSVGESSGSLIFGFIPRPLVAAARMGRFDMVALLLNFETRREAFGEAIRTARRRGSLSIANLIQRYVDKENAVSPSGQGR